ncbi:hypothetical protein RJ639_006095 [Escallonia herrerae]|uniref:Pentatricopeptide repeat-containing protein n=1 Tax=Escallonia herrerae TaxID=1293975 RepID=A0AA88VZ90_9ASTE|nr:hypothetical protein RJ639_006095 [Escallonia herrerae]
MEVSSIRSKPTIFIGLLRCIVDLELGKQLHSHAIKTALTNNVSMDATILNMYVKCGCLENAELVFDQMLEKNAVAWTGLMVGFTQLEKQQDALKLFATMAKEGFQFDEFVFSITLKACAGLEDLEMGRQVHGYVLKLGLEDNVSVGTPLVDFYVKCRVMESARRAFERISEPNDVSWSAIISGYSQIGEFGECIKIFKSLRSKDVVLNSFIYTNIFQACSAIAASCLGTQAH